MLRSSLLTGLLMMLTAIALLSRTMSAFAASTTPPQPTGDPGNWTLKFDDEFSGTSLDTTDWTAITPNNSNVVGDPADVSVSGGDLNLTLSAAGSSSARGAGGFVESKGFQLPVGGFMEASIDFPGPGTTAGTSIDNWSGFWASGGDWPANGEEDVVETLGSATSNYHSPAGTSNSGPIAGNWSNSFHTYGMYRGANSVTIYWDGKVVRTYATDDAGGVQEILLDAASSTGPDTTIDSPTVTGAASVVKVAYVRAWVPS